MRAQLEVFAVLTVAGLACLFILTNLLLGRLLRRRAPNAEKEEPYECGEPAIGSAWVQFDIRYYVPAILFVAFDVELALLFPWAVVFGEPGAAGPALMDLALFMALPVLALGYLWRQGALEWVRTLPVRSDVAGSAGRPSGPRTGSDGSGASR